MVYLRRGAYIGNRIGEKNRRDGAAVDPVEVRQARGTVNLQVILASQLPARCVVLLPPFLFHGGWR
jgi:hypothetical protein